MKDLFVFFGSVLLAFAGWGLIEPIMYHQLPKDPLKEIYYAVIGLSGVFLLVGSGIIVAVREKHTPLELGESKPS